MPPGVVAAVLLSALLHAGWNALLRNSTDRSWAVGWIGVSTMIVCAPLLPFVGWPASVWPLMLVSSAFHVVYLLLLAQAYRHSELSFAYPIARGSSPMLVTIGGLLIASEHPSPLQAAGTVAVVLGIVALGLDSQAWDQAGFRVALAIGVVIAAYTVIDGIAVRRSGMPTQYNLWCFSLYGLTMLLIQLKTRGAKALAGDPKQIGLVFGGGVISVVAYAIVTWAMVHAPMGMVSALRETSTLFAALLGFLFLKERFSWKKLAFCSSIAAGAVIIGLS